MADLEQLAGTPAEEDGATPGGTPAEWGEAPRLVRQPTDRAWRLRQRWSQLLFAHWPMPETAIQARLPPGLTVDRFDGWAWLGVVPFVMDRVRVRIAGEHSAGVPGATAFPELNLRTYVRAPDGTPGVYFFSLDAGSLLAVAGARVGFGLPYFWARMGCQTEPHRGGDMLTYRSERLAGGDVRFLARYRPLGVASPRDDLRGFLTERYALLLRRFGAVQIGHIHHAPWDLQEAEAEFLRNDLPASFGFTLPDRPPVLHYSPEVHMRAWTLRRLPVAGRSRSV